MMNPLYSKVKPSHKPKTLEEHMEDSKKKYPTTGEEVQSHYKEKAKESPASTKPYLTNLGPRIPEDWKENKHLKEWEREKYATKIKYKGERWLPTKRLSAEQMEGVRLLKRSMPHMTASDLAAEFEVSPEAIRRILGSKWKPKTEEEEDRIKKRWTNRGLRIKSAMDAKSDPVVPVMSPLSVVKINSTRSGEQMVHYKSYRNKNSREKPHVETQEDIQRKRTRATDRLFKIDRTSIRKTRF
ncbi:hypothetical protein WICPIJ_009361 [Wickerhamomyces pijperi]|uniref:Required for respiratory growth protein 9, mitochondrial n=1 Tax=Wickerhamomyces pijperi TaxID=599730 RepID=A0A9P8PP76_WICPI|nr:hypothetical protein WICPIJ_009361 [Wickerhamomyces pijperi]